MPNALAMPWSDIQLGAPHIHCGMCIVPILNPRAAARRYLTTNEALARGGLQITEISSDGSVPALRAANDLDQGVLLVDGEELLGAKQNRVLNLSVLIPGGTSVTLPVSCVEAGRWETRSSSMQTSGHLDALPIRRKRIDSVSRSARRREAFSSDQNEVWDSVSELLATLDIESGTGAMHDGYAARSHDLETYVDAFEALEHQIGALIAIDGRWTSIELFSHPDLYAAHAGKIIRSSAMALISEPALATTRPPADEAAAILGELAGSEIEAYAAVGLGSTLRLESHRWHGSAVSDGQALIHLVAYAR